MKMLFYLFHKQSDHTCNYTERCKNILNYILAKEIDIGNDATNTTYNNQIIREWYHVYRYSPIHVYSLKLWSKFM